MKTKKRKMFNGVKGFITGGVAFAPFLALAATITDIIGNIQDIVNLLVPLLIGIAVIYFIWGVIKYISAGADEGKREEARNTMIYGIIGLFVIVAIWGLVGVISSTFDIETGGTIDRPLLPD
jgi:uncharacterized membrane protein YidH (DUF202 family)